MGFESEVYILLIVGFLAVMAVSMIMLGFVSYKTKNKNIGWFFLQSIFLLLAFYKFYSVFRVESGAMSSESASVLIAQSGIFWAISMIAMCIGAMKLSLNKKNQGINS